VDHRLLDDAPVAQMLDHDPLKQARSDGSVPHPFRIHDHDRPAAAHTETRGLSALHSVRAEE